MGMIQLNHISDSGYERATADEAAITTMAANHTQEMTRVDFRKTGYPSTAWAPSPWRTGG